MKPWLAFWIPVAVVLAIGFHITALVGGFGTGTSPLGNAIGTFALTLAAFTESIVLRFDWWVTLSMLAVAFRIVHRDRPRPDPADPADEPIP